jgi:hypothetical protein
MPVCQQMQMTRSQARATIRVACGLCLPQARALGGASGGGGIATMLLSLGR